MTPAPKTRREQAEEAAKKREKEWSADADWDDPETAAAIANAYDGYLQGWTDADSTPPPQEGDGESHKSFVDSFLAWPLPNSVCSDPCASAPNYPHRSGTNLLNATEAEALFKDVVAPMIAHARRTQAAEIKKFREALEDMVDCVPGTEMYFAARDLAKIVLEDYAKLTSNAAQGGEGEG